MLRWDGGAGKVQDAEDLRPTGAFLNHVGNLCISFWSEDLGYSFGIPVHSIRMMERAEDTKTLPRLSKDDAVS